MRQLVATDSDIDRELSSAQVMVDPYPIYAKLRAKYPIFWSASWNAWIVSRYSDVVVSLRDNQSLSNENRQELLFVNLADDELDDLRDLRHYFAQKDVIGSDPPDHTRLRALVQKVFTVLERAPRLSLVGRPMVWLERVQFRGPKELWVHQGPG